MHPVALPSPAASQAPQHFLATADAIGARLARDAIWQGARCNWTGDSMESIGGHWQVAHRALGCEIYSGTSGVALFLARLYAATRERLYAKVAIGALEQAASQADTLAAGARSGFYAGALGVAWALVRAGHVVDAPRLVERGWLLLQSVQDAPNVEQGVDVTSGSAGAIGALLDLAQLAGTDETRRTALLEAARRHGQHLIDTARRSERGWCWGPEAAPGATHGLCGLSHGAAGIAWSLLNLYRAVGDDQFMAASREAVRYEQSWFSTDEQNWPDLRSQYDPTLGDGKRLTYMSAWCHGAPGIGLARLASYAATKDESCLSAARAALRSTSAGLRMGLGQPLGAGNFSLCHGWAGNADLLIEAARVLGEPEHLSLAHQVGQIGQVAYACSGAPWPCGVAGGGETPSLMLGLAGIGYFYLRLHDPGTPTVLLPGRDEL